MMLFRWRSGRTRGCEDPRVEGVMRACPEVARAVCYLKRDIYNPTALFVL